MKNMDKWKSKEAVTQKNNVIVKKIKQHLDSNRV